MAGTRWKKADYRSTTSMLGFIRIAEKSIGGQSIPFPIRCHCISYYFVNDYFTTHGPNIKINEYKNIAEGTTKWNKRNAVYGNEVIDLSKRENLHNKYRWTFKVSQTDPDSPGFWLGINNSNKSILSQRDLLNDDTIKKFRSYSVTNKSRIVGSSHFQGDDVRWNRKWGTESIIEMEIVYKKVQGHKKRSSSMANSINPLLDAADLKWFFGHDYGERTEWKWHLIFTVNGQTGKDLVVAIDPSVYHLTAIMSEKGQKIELIKFELDCSPNLDPSALQFWDSERISISSFKKLWHC